MSRYYDYEYDGMTDEYLEDDFIIVWETEDEFVEDIQNSGLNVITEESLRKLYKLLYAEYSGRHIANFTVNKFKYKVAKIIFEFGPTWEKKLDVQKAIRELTLDDLRSGSFVDSINSNNPGNKPTEYDISDHRYWNNKNSSVLVKSKLEGYSNLLDLLDEDITQDFINKFDRLFSKWTCTARPVYFIYSEENE